MKKIFLLLSILVAKGVFAQTFHNAIKVEFEKTVYVRQLIKDRDPEWFERFKDRWPETFVSYFDFIGDSTASVYKTGREVEVDARSWYQPVGDKNITYNNYAAKRTITQKPVFEETFLVDDSLLKIKWKLTADTRVIAGYECRKAVGIVDDSIAVFAFYTDEILVNGGPETIHGLPGMILGVGVPRLHTTWFATKVEVNGINLAAVKPATKGKKTTRKAMLQSIHDAIKNWGTYGRSMYLNFVI